MNPHLEVLRRVTRDMAAIPRLSVLLESIVKALHEHTGASIARIWLYRTDDECEVCRANPDLRGPTGRDERALHLAASIAPPGGPTLLPHRVEMHEAAILTRVARDRAAQFTNDMSTVVRAGDNEVQTRNLASLGIVAMGGQPLEFRGELLGVMGMLYAKPIQPIEIDLLRIFADQAAAAIKNAFLFEEVERFRQRLADENAYLRDETQGQHEFREIVGGSPALHAVLRKIKQVAEVETTVLLTGETGTGKELVARAIHARSPRRERPMIKMNCGAIPSGVVESELFGHEKGAFTGAMQRRIGRFELADRSTLFMDEVGELPLDTQVKLLRILQEQEFERVGGARPVKVDVRLVAATNRDLEHEVADGRMRSDLFYRLNVFPIHIPPLRDRPSDIPLLVQHFLRHFQRKLGKPLREVSKRGMQQLQAYEWPGNIRELQNVVERACVLARGPVVDVGEAMYVSDREAPIATSREPLVTLEEHERRHIRRALAMVHGKIHGPGGAAELLGVNASTLRSRMEKLGITKEG